MDDGEGQSQEGKQQEVDGRRWRMMVMVWRGQKRDGWRCGGSGEVGEEWWSLPERGRGRRRQANGVGVVGR
jgi:hypothetical protein